MEMMSDPTQPLAVLVSGGIDSAVLLGLAAQTHPAVFPLYVKTGLIWEEVELAYLRRFLTSIPALRPLVQLEQPIQDLYGQHWSVTGAAPGPTAPDEEFYLPGRNILLLTKAMLWCRFHDVPAIALAVLAANPFPDATPEFFHDYSRVVSRAVGGDIQIVTPFATLSKAEVIRRGRDFPLQHTLSCASPVHDCHCGICGKCAERGRAFQAAGVPDPTDYASQAWMGTTQTAAGHRPWE